MTWSRSLLDLTFVNGTFNAEFGTAINYFLRLILNDGTQYSNILDPRVHWLDFRPFFGYESAHPEILSLQKYE